MSHLEANTKRPRHSFGKIQFSANMPHLIEVQKNSYAEFLQSQIKPDERDEIGLQSVYKSVFPITDYTGQADLEFVNYSFGEPKFDVEECIKKGLTFSAPLKVNLRLIIWDIDEDNKSKTIRDIKEQEVFMGELPLMTKNGTFIYNGVERVVVSQMQRSPGAFFDHDKGKSHASGKLLYTARIIPDRGSWLDFEFDAKDILNVRIDRKRKLPVTTLLYALPPEEGSESGLNKDEILGLFYHIDIFKKDKDGFWKTDFDPEKISKSIKLTCNWYDVKKEDIVLKAGQKLFPKRAKRMFEDGLKNYRVKEEDMLGKYIATDFVDEATGEVLIEAGEELTDSSFEILKKHNVDEIPVLFADDVNIGSHIRNTLITDKNSTREDALIDIYQVIRPGEPPTLEAAENLFNSLFFDSDRYDLSKVGRFKMNTRLDISFEDAPEDLRVLRNEDIIKTIKTLVELKDNYGPGDDIDNLGNRRVRSVGELLENQFRIGLVRMERSIKERMSSVDIDRVMPQDLINAKAIVNILKDFFGLSQLSKFMDQTNPLSETTDKRRLSALGPGGLTRERAGFEVRDVHPTHYGRICPIETPEGQNIGLINSLATYAKINKYGFIETPYRKVVNGKVTDEVIYMSAMEEKKYVIAQANEELDSKGSFAEEKINCRKSGDFILVDKEEIDFMDISPKQIVSVAAALIPFLENTDANRALMGSNMQRQAVPLVRSEAPFVGTGIESKVAMDSGAVIVAEEDGIVKKVDANKIVIQSTSEDADPNSIIKIYSLLKFQRSNQNTCINQKPLVKVGDVVKKGDIIADGPSTDLGELSLGRNVLVAFMPWNGYNYEDSVVISERIVREDTFTSIHIEEFDVMTRDTKLGSEEITRDIPNVSESSLRHLDEVGIVHVGAKVTPGDILVGKVTPKGETLMTPEEKLLRAIFGEKAADVRDTSLRVPSGTEGIVVDVRTFSRKGVEKDERSLALEYREMEKLKRDRDAQRHIIEEGFADKIKELILGKKLSSEVKPFGKKGEKITEEMLEKSAPSQWKRIVVNDEKVMKTLEGITQELGLIVKNIDKRYDDQVDKLKAGDELPQGVLKMVKVFIAVKRKLQPGDKMAGRHGNKGVVSKIVPIEDMPYQADGTPVDIVLNPHGLPSRMNIGQILETHLGWACKKLGKQVGELVNKVQANQAKINEVKDKLKDIYGADSYNKMFKGLNDDEVLQKAESLKSGIRIATPVFDGAKEENITEMLKKAELPETGQIDLFDGKTGEKFDKPITVGYIYYLKLYHLVDEKIHARSVGPYSLVTQQPLGGKAQFGGQRFGEMEVWALEAYGASYTLQEMLTVKSDDVSGRTKVYESIVRGNNEFESGLPESFNVLVKEIKSLGLNIELKE